jgi:hypothetical protein
LEIWQTIGGLSPGVAVGVVCLFFYNQLTLKYLEERREMLQTLATERKEWNDALQRMIDRYDARSQATIVAMEKMAAEMHALRGRLQEFMSNVELRLRGNSGGND